MRTRREVNRVQLFSVPSVYGRGANEGCYYPHNLLLIASHLRRVLPEIAVEIVDRTLESLVCPDAPIVGISATSTQNYASVLSTAREAKSNGCIVVLGGPHTTHLSEQILRNRTECVDYVIRGYGEHSFARLVAALRFGRSVADIDGLSWRNASEHIRHNPVSAAPWRYEDFLLVDFSLLHSGVQRYWANFRQCIDRDTDAAFLMFTHFGCGYHSSGRHRAPAKGCLSSVCSYCSLDGPVMARTGRAIVDETLGMLNDCQVPRESRVLLKCYGDNVGTQPMMLYDLAETIKSTPAWRQYEIGWTFYCQSTRLTEQTARLLARVGARNLYIGFDSADDRVQRINGLGTSMRSHEKAIDIARRFTMDIQAGFVLGCAGETPESLERTVAFAERLSALGILERTNSAILIIMPGAPAYNALCAREPWIRDLDLLPTREIQLLWLKHFCPKLGATPEEGMVLLEAAANRIDQLSPGPHASMGFVSKALTSHVQEVCTA